MLGNGVTTDEKRKLRCSCIVEGLVVTSAVGKLNRWETFFRHCTRLCRLGTGRSLFEKLDMESAMVSLGRDAVGREKGVGVGEER